MNDRIDAEHGVVCSMPNDFFGYFGWPTLARMDDGTLVLGSSGFRTAHVCPYGRSVLFFSKDDGRTWSGPHIVNDTPADDRDVGLLNLGGSGLLMTWFTVASRPKPGRPGAFGRSADEMRKECQGSWIRLSHDAGQTWGPPSRAPVNSPHGPIRLANGKLLYLGKTGFDGSWESEGSWLGGVVCACESSDSGKTWDPVGDVPLPPVEALADPPVYFGVPLYEKDLSWRNFHEAHVVELPSGRLIGMVRYGAYGPKARPLTQISICQTESEDAGRTWSRLRPTGICGTPPHIIRHSSGVLVCVYGRRKPPEGQRVMFSYDDGASWQTDYILRDDGPDWDLGYPSSVELSDGSLLTAYYQKIGQGGPNEKPSLLCSHWRLPVTPLRVLSSE